LDKVYPRCAGIDVHKDTLVVCIRLEGKELPVETYGATVSQILALGDRLAELGVTIAAMESTGVYWKAPWNLLEDRLQLMLVNAQHIKRVPGRKTDVTDSQWIAQLLEHGLLSASFVPARPQRELRDLTRQRTQLLGDRSRVLNRVHKTLESSNFKLGSIFSDIGGASGTRVLLALVENKLSVDQMVELVDRRMTDKKPALKLALAAKMNEHHRFMLRQLLEQIEHIDKQIDAFDLRIQEVMSPLEKQMVTRLDEVPGLDVRSGQNIIAEIGTDMSRFPSAAHLSSWAGLCPGNNQSGGKRKNGKTRKANRWLKTALTQAAWGASRTRKSHFAARHRQLSKRRGKKRASIAIARGLLEVAYHLISHPDVAYTDLGPNHHDQANTDRQIKSMLRRLKSLGCQVDIKRTAA
jgi:transposase